MIKSEWPSVNKAAEVRAFLENNHLEELELSEDLTKATSSEKRPFILKNTDNNAEISFNFDKI